MDRDADNGGEPGGCGVVRPLVNRKRKKPLSEDTGGASSAIPGLSTAGWSSAVGVAADRRQPTSLEADERFKASSSMSLFASDIFRLLCAIASCVSSSFLAAAVTLSSVHYNTDINFIAHIYAQMNIRTSSSTRNIILPNASLKSSSCPCLCTRPLSRTSSAIVASRAACSDGIAGGAPALCRFLPGALREGIKREAGGPGGMKWDMCKSCARVTAGSGHYSN